MALAANALTTVAIAKEHLEVAVADITKDARIERLVNTASAMIAKYTRRVLVTIAHTTYFDGRSSNRLMPKHWPVTGGPAAGATKPAIYIDHQSLFAAGTELDPAAYAVDADGITIVRVDGGSFPKGYRNIKVVYDAGLGTVAGGTLPADLVHACLELVKWYYLGLTNSTVGVKSKGKGGEQTVYETEIPSHVALLLDSYVRHEFHVGDVPVANG